MDVDNILEEFEKSVKVSVNYHYFEVINEIKDSVNILLETVISNTETFDNSIRNAVIETKERLSGASNKDEEQNPTNPDDGKDLAQKQQSQKHNVMQSTLIFNEMKKQIKPAHIKDAARKSNAEKDDMPRRNNTPKEPLPPIMRERQLENEAPDKFYDEPYVPQRRENSNLFRDTFSKLDALFSKSTEINRNLDRISEPNFNRNPPIHTMRPPNDRAMEIERMERREPDFDRNQPIHPMRPPPDINYNRVPEIRQDEHRDADFKIIRPNHSVRSPTDAQVNRITELIKEEYREPDFKRRQSNYPMRPPIDAMFNRELEIKQEEQREEAFNRDQPVHSMRRPTDTRFDRVTEIKMEECREPDLNRNYPNRPIRLPPDAMPNRVTEIKQEESRDPDMNRNYTNNQMRLPADEMHNRVTEIKQEENKEPDMNENPPVRRTRNPSDIEAEVRRSMGTPAVHAPTDLIKTEPEINVNPDNPTDSVKADGWQIETRMMPNGNIIRNFVCDECGYVSNNNNNLQWHIVRKHKPPRKWKCEECDHISMTQWEHGTHLRTKHDR